MQKLMELYTFWSRTVKKHKEYMRFGVVPSNNTWNYTRFGVLPWNAQAISSVWESYRQKHWIISVLESYHQNTQAIAFAFWSYWNITITMISISESYRKQKNKMNYERFGAVPSTTQWRISVLESYHQTQHELSAFWSRISKTTMDYVSFWSRTCQNTRNYLRFGVVSSNTKLTSSLGVVPSKTPGIISVLESYRQKNIKIYKRFGVVPSKT